MAVAGMPVDPWVILPKERERFEMQFHGLKPINGHITGDQAKGFLLQSQLPPQTLGLIWGLADRDADGKMDINEFSIACKLIMLKLKGVEVPRALPTSLLTSLAAVSTPPMAAGTPPQVPPPPKITPPAVPPMMAQPPIIPPAPVLAHGPGMVMHQQPQMVAPHPGMVPMAPQVQPMMMPGIQPMVAPQMPPQVAPMVVPMSAPQVVPMVAPMVAHPPVLPPQPSLGTPPLMSPPTVDVPMAAPVVPPMVPPPSEAAKQRSGSVVSVDLNSPLEWSVPHQSKLRYTQVFNSNDRTRCGHLTGPQARNILIQWRLPQATLAQIWALSDLDSDGRLSCDEFVLSMHLCEIASKGEKIPQALPLDLIPPSFRRGRVGSLKAVSGTTTPTGIQSGPGSVDGDLGSPTSQSSFEDKRKKNYEKGQAELERRRRALLEVQKKEQEERERKEREEHEKREKLRLEQERKQQEELERQLQMQKEQEEKQEEERRRAQEQKEAARKEMERQRQLEWEKQRSQELQQQRQKEQEKVLQLKAQNQNLGIELSQKSEKVRELSQKISETRAAVSAVKTTIDGMRATRDESMAEMSALKAKLREQNNRLVNLSQEKARMDARNRANSAVDGADVNHAFNNKQIILKQMQDKLNEQDKENEQKRQDIKNNNQALAELRKTLKGLIDRCEISYPDFEDKRQKVCIMKNRVVDDYNAQWGDSGTTNTWTSQEPNQNTWNTDSTWSSTTVPQPEATPVEAVPGMTRYRALFEFVARNPDELSFQPGDVILVPDDHNAEPGWLAGKIRDSTGWFPESYVERIDTEVVSNGNVAAVETEERKPLEGIAEVPETTSDNGSLTDHGPAVVDPVSTPTLGTGQTMPNVFARTLYSFKGKKASHLNFSKGVVITVHEQQDQWSYGELNGLQGWFPNSYVKIEDSTPSIAAAGEYYMAMYPYQSEESGDLSFNQGEVILVSKKDGEWWTGTINGEKTGLFPASYVSIIETQEAPDQPDNTGVDINAAVAAVAASQETQAEKSALHDEVKQITEQQNFKAKTESVTTPDSLGSKSPLPMGKGKKPEIAQVLAPYKATSTEQLSLNRGQLVMVRKKTTTGWWEGELQAKGKKRQVGWFPASYVKLLVSSGTASGRTTPTAKFRDTPSPMPGKDRVIAMYSYVAQNSDELSFEKDEVITVTSRDDPSWWKGELHGLSGLFPSNYVSAIPTDNSRMSGPERARQGYITELIETEQSYINDMTVVHEAFEKPLLESNVISKEDVEKIFVNWKDILQCNCVFLSALRVRRDMSPGGEIRMIGDILCENLPRMAAYARFFSCQLRAADLLQYHTENTPEFRSFVRQCEIQSVAKGLPLSSFLIKPMQRITKYPLIIKKILENTPEDHPDHQNLEEAMASAEEFCTLVNEGVREREDSDRLEWLQRNVQADQLEEQLVFNSLTNMLGQRKLIHFGVLKKVNSGRELVGFLMNDFLLLASPNKPLKSTAFSFERHKGITMKIYKKPFFLNEIKFSAGNENEELVLQDDNRSYLLNAPSYSERSLWLRLLTEAKSAFLEKESSFLLRQQSKKSSFGAIGRVMIAVIDADTLSQSSVRQRPPKGSLQILHVSGEQIGSKGSSGKSDIFCDVSMGSQEKRTPAVSGPNPKWNFNMQFLIKDLNEDVLCFTVFSKGYFAPNEFLGRAEVRIKDIPFDATSASTGPFNNTLRLREVKSGTLSIKLDLRLFESTSIPSHRQRLI
ncbi:intersectin-2 isoform X1 [Cloeon dipterum]|uniref:intersectin-2 isoform X1 n=1 Tax=Cloeon dipterum TaxID=197152 RepID=UPI0032203BD2